MLKDGRKGIKKSGSYTAVKLGIVELLCVTYKLYSPAISYSWVRKSLLSGQKEVMSCHPEMVKGSFGNWNPLPLPTYLI